MRVTIYIIWSIVCAFFISKYYANKDTPNLVFWVGATILGNLSYYSHQILEELRKKQPLVFAGLRY
jgi:hypothetical protein